MREIILLATGLCIWMGFPGTAAASCSPLSTCSCRVSATSFQFGVYNPLRSAPTDSTGNIQVNCSAGPGATSLSYEIRLSAGDAGSYQSRQLAGPGGSIVTYNLYTDAARTQIWGDGSGTTSVVTGDFPVLLPSSNVQNHPVYGRMPAQQMEVISGGYADSILITVIY